MAKFQLSKSSYIRGLQCLKSLYLYKFHYEQRDKISRQQLARFNRGHDIGKLAQQLFPGGIDASISAKQKSLQAQLKTFELIQHGHNIIYEASFVYDDVWVIADIIEKKDEGWKVYEVKSSAAISDTYMNDAALQYYVISNALPQLTQQPVIDFSLIYVNRNYVREEKIDLNKMFLTSSVRNFCEDNLSLVTSKIAKAKDVLENGKVPAIETGDHCFKPYTCDYIGTCWKNRPLPQEQLPVPDKEKIKLFFDATPSFNMLEWIMHRPAMPPFIKTRPYQAQVFSIRTELFQAGKSNSTNYVADSGMDPNLAVIPEMIKLLKNALPILVCNFESKQRALIEMADNYPQFKSELQDISERLVDMFSLFQVDAKSEATLELLLKVTKLKKPFIKSSVFDDISAAASFEKMQNHLDLFANEESRQAIEDYNSLNMSMFLKALQNLRLL